MTNAGRRHLVRRAPARLRRRAHGRRAAVRPRPPLVPLAHRALRPRGLRAGRGRPGGARVRRGLGLRRGPGHGRAGRDPLPRRARGGGRDAPARMAAAVPQARHRDADHRRDRRARRARADRPGLDGELPARLDPRPDGPRAVLQRRDEPAGAAPRAPLAQPRVRPQRRPRAAGRARVLRGAARGRRGLHVVAVRAPGRDARLRLRDRARLRRRRCCCRGRAGWPPGSPTTRSRSTRSAPPSPPTASPCCCRSRATA